MATINSGTVETLAADFAGELIQPREPGYHVARQIWNGHVQRRPARIARCRGVAHVMATVRFCREHDLPASVRCGGRHAVAGHAMCEGGVVIHLSAMTGSRVDPLARTSRSRAAAACSRIGTDRARRSGSPQPAGSSATPGLAA
jgi:FAD binding domain